MIELKRRAEILLAELKRNWPETEDAQAKRVVVAFESLLRGGSAVADPGRVDAAIKEIQRLIGVENPKTLIEFPYGAIRHVVAACLMSSPEPRPVGPPLPPDPVSLP